MNLILDLLWNIILFYYITYVEIKRNKMSAQDQMRDMLDQLMGTARDGEVKLDVITTRHTTHDTSSRRRRLRLSSTTTTTIFIIFL